MLNRPTDAPKKASIGAGVVAAVAAGAALAGGAVVVAGQQADPTPAPTAVPAPTPTSTPTPAPTAEPTPLPNTPTSQRFQFTLGRGGVSVFRRSLKVGVGPVVAQLIFSGATPDVTVTLRIESGGKVVTQASAAGRGETGQELIVSTTSASPGFYDIIVEGFFSGISVQCTLEVTFPAP